MRILLVLLALIPYFASAELFRGPLSASMGGTGRAGLGSAEGAFINPALLPLIKDYEFLSYYRDGYAAPGRHQNAWAVGAIDNSEGVWFPGSLHYVKLRDTGRAGKPANGEVWHAAGAYLLSDRVSVGASAYRLHWDLKSAEDYIQWNGSLGAVVLLHPDFSLAYVLDNLAKPGSDVPRGLREDMRQSLGLFGRIAEIASLRLDISREEKYNPDKKMAWMIGMETLTSDFFLIHLGFRRDEFRDQKVWTAGLSFNGPRLKVDYALEKDERLSGALHSVDLRVPF